MKILITSWRSFVSLEFIRILAGHEIYIQENQEEFICKSSKYIKGVCKTDAPKFEFENYKNQILTFITENKIDIVLPTCEDIFYISRLKYDIENLGCKIICDDFEMLKLFHSKKEIMKISQWLWIQIPKTYEFTSKELLISYIETHPDFLYVIKPKYSRFGNFISSNVIPKSKSIDEIEIDLDNNSYILQEFIAGQNICSYSIFENGNLVSHLNYNCLLTYNNGSATFFESFENDDILNFVKIFAKKYNINWQISFDYIIQSDGKVCLIECNPRTTSWLHLLRNNDEFKNTFLTYLKWISYKPYVLKKKVRTWFFFINLLYTFSVKKFSYWIDSLTCDVVFDTKDISPFLRQLSLLKYYKNLSRKKNMTLTQVTSYDIEYDWI